MSDLQQKREKRVSFDLNVVGGEVEVVEAQEEEGASDEYADCEDTVLIPFY